jgi:hypothetical protein
MKYLKGYLVKPLKVKDGNVVFTDDGTTEIMPSQVSCEAYGYTWNKSSSTCMIRGYESGVIQLNKKFTNAANTMGGSRNKLGGFVSNSAVYGSNNRFEGGNKNIIINGNKNLVKSNVFDSAIISGSSNTLTEDVNNSTVISGVGAVSIRDNETVIGGFYNEGSSLFGDAPSFTTQVSKFVMQTTVEDAFTVKHLTIAGLDYIPTHPNSRIFLKVTGMVVGDNGNLEQTATLQHATIYVNDNGVAGMVEAKYESVLNTNATITTNSIYTAIVNDKLSICIIGSAIQKLVAVASIEMTELIFESNPR